MSTEGAELWREGRRAAHEAKTHEDEQRQAQVQAIENTEFQNPQDAFAAINMAYAHEPQESRMARFGRWLTRRKAEPQAAAAAPTATSQTPAMDIGGVKVPEGKPVTVTGPAPRNKQEAITNFLAQHGVSRGQVQGENKTAADEASERRIREQREKVPTATAMKHEEYLQAVRDGYDGSEDEYHAQQAALGRTKGSPLRSDVAARQDWQKAVQDGYEGSFLQWKAEEASKGKAQGTPDTTTTGTHTVMVRQPDGTTVPVQVQTSSTKSVNKGKGATQGETPSKGPAPRKFSGAGGPNIKVGPAIGQTKDYATAKTNYETARFRMDVMDKAKPKALAGDQQAMVALLANHIGMTLGLQRGARITRAVWEEAAESAPWLQRVEAKFGPDGYLAGVVLTPQQIEQITGLGHDMVETTKKQVDRLSPGGNDLVDHAPENRSNGSAPAPKAKEKKNAAGDTIVQGSDGKWSLKNAAATPNRP